MIKKIIIDAGQSQIRVAFLEDDELVEYYVEDIDNQGIVGNIYRGKVSNVLPGMQAAFVDIGLEKNAFLYISDIDIDKAVFEFMGSNGSHNENSKLLSIADILSEGQEITVQVIKEPIGTKGARVTTHLTLPGKYLVLMPTVNHVGVSRKIDNEKERQRLKSIAESIKPDNMGLIVRTAAEDMKAEDFIPDLQYLTELWSSARKKERKGKVPRIIYKDENIIYRTVRDVLTDDIDKLIINSEEGYNKLMSCNNLLPPSLMDKVELYDSDEHLFDYYGINSKIRTALQKKVWLKNGGYIVIEPTEALTVIDVNTGRFVSGVDLEDTVFKVNLAAAEEIAHQIRLRDMGGIIIVDFIDMADTEHRQLLINTIKAHLKRDRTKTSVVGITGLGLVEITRKQVKKGLTPPKSSICPHCNGTGYIDY